MLVAENEELKSLPRHIGSTNPLYSDYLPEHIINREGRSRWTSLVDGKGRFRNAYKAYTDDPSSYIIHLTSHSASAEYLSFLHPFLSVCLRRNKHSGLVQVARFSPSAYITQQAEILLDQ